MIVVWVLCIVLISCVLGELRYKLIKKRDKEQCLSLSKNWQNHIDQDFGDNNICYIDSLEFLRLQKIEYTQKL